MHMQKPVLLEHSHDTLLTNLDLTGKEHLRDGRGRGGRLHHRQVEHRVSGARLRQRRLRQGTRFNRKKLRLGKKQLEF